MFTSVAWVMFVYGNKTDHKVVVMVHFEGGSNGRHCSYKVWGGGPWLMLSSWGEWSGGA